MTISSIESQLIEHEALIFSQMKEIEQRVDRRYRAYGSGAGVFLVSSLSLFFGPMLGVMSGFLSVRRNRRQLAELLLIKQEIASKNLRAIIDCRPSINTLANEALSLLMEESNAEFQIGNWQSVKDLQIFHALETCRRAVYLSVAAQFLEQEYGAWLADFHNCDLPDPTMLEANRIILNKIYPSNDTLQLFASASAGISGARLLVLSDQGLFAAILQRIGLEGNSSGDLRPPYKKFNTFRIEHLLKCALKRPNDPLISELLKRNKTYKRMRRRFLSVKIRRKLGGNVIAALFGGGVVYYLLMKLLENWAAWARWSFGLVGGVLVFIIWLALFLTSIATSKWTRRRTQRNTYRLLCRLGGDPGISNKVAPKNYITEGVKGYFGF